MNNTLKIINAIKFANKYKQENLDTLITSLEDEIVKLYQNIQIELINNISKDYNINSKELVRKYVNKKKMHKNKKKDNYLDSPNVYEQTNYDTDSYNTSEEYYGDLHIFDQSNINESNTIENSPSPTNLSDSDINNYIINSKILFKNIKIADKIFLLNINTNEIYDNENNLVGKKKDDIYYIYKSSFDN